MREWTAKAEVLVSGGGKDICQPAQAKVQSLQRRCRGSREILRTTKRPGKKRQGVVPKVSHSSMRVQADYYSLCHPLTMFLLFIIGQGESLGTA